MFSAVWHTELKDERHRSVFRPAASLAPLRRADFLLLKAESLLKHYQRRSD